MDIVLVIIFIFILAYTVICIGALFKNENTYRNRTIISDAIADYSMHKIDRCQWNSIEVDFDDMESYEATFVRWWDWGYTRILPPEKFEIIKPYIR